MLYQESTKHPFLGYSRQIRFKKLTFEVPSKIYKWILPSPSFCQDKVPQIKDENAFIATSGFATTHVVVSVRHPITY